MPERRIRRCRSPERSCGNKACAAPSGLRPTERASRRPDDRFRRDAVIANGKIEHTRYQRDSPSNRRAGSCRAGPRASGPATASCQERKVRLGTPKSGPVSCLGERSVAIRAHVIHGPSRAGGPLVDEQDIVNALTTQAEPNGKAAQPRADDNHVEGATPSGARRGRIHSAGGVSIAARSRRTCASSRSSAGISACRPVSCGAELPVRSTGRQLPPLDEPISDIER